MRREPSQGTKGHEGPGGCGWQPLGGILALVMLAGGLSMGVIVAVGLGGRQNHASLCKEQVSSDVIVPSLWACMGGED